MRAAIRGALSVLPLMMACWGCVAAPRNPILSRDGMLAAVVKSDGSFPDGTTVQLTHFSHIGSLSIKGERVEVAYMRQVIRGMLAPRGRSFVVLVGKTGVFLGKVAVDCPPLWCSGAQVFLFGVQSNGQESGNVLDFSDGANAPRLRLVPAYGSYQPE